MRIHRTEHRSRYVVIPNGVAQSTVLSLTAIGLLTYLLSRRDGTPETARDLAKRFRVGRRTLQKAFHELIAAGHYWVEKIRQADGTITSVPHVWDTPHATPGSVCAPPPASGEPTPGRAGILPKDRGKATTLPPTPPEPATRAEPAPETPVDEQTRTAVATLHRAIRPEPRLRIGHDEALALAPLVTPWLQRGAGATELSAALLPGLPVVMHSATAILRNRLVRKLPPEPIATQATAPRYAECTRCHDPVPRPGTCRPCAGLAPHPAPRSTTPPPGAGRARQALRTAKAALGRPTAPPALC
jgi:hypothetical protein